MLRFFSPGIYVNSVTELDLNELKRRGFSSILLDLDNTIVPWGEDTLIPDLEGWMARAFSMGFKACIVSNSSPRRAARISKKLDIPFICPALKPLRRSFFKALRLIGGETAGAVMIGDQIFTDVFGANRAGIFSVLVKPVHSKELFTTRIVRRFEKSLIKLLKNKGIFL